MRGAGGRFEPTHRRGAHSNGRTADRLIVATGVGLGWAGKGWGNRAAAARGTAGGEKDKGLEIPLR